MPQQFNIKIMDETEKNDILLAKFAGYYQPTEVQDNLHSFEVYASLENCKKDFPDTEISTYYGGDIEDFTFADVPEYHTSYDSIMPVVEKIAGELHKTEIVSDEKADYCRITIYHATETSHEIYECGLTILEATYKAVIEFIKWYNKQQSN